MVNFSLVQTLPRSINTSLTTLFPLTALLLFGGPTIKNFIFALLIGVITGTYSSICNASPILVAWRESKKRRALAAKELAYAGASASSGTPTPSKPTRPEVEPDVEETLEELEAEEPTEVKPQPKPTFGPGKATKKKKKKRKR
jgi:hypothetical protein